MQLGFELALMGMGTVFAFLVLLILLTTLMSKVINAIEKLSSQSANEVSADAGSAGRMSDETLRAVIQAAVQAHRSQQQKALIND